MAKQNMHTHKGTIINNIDKRPQSFRDVPLRETSQHYITAKGTKYRKRTGDPVKPTRPARKLLIDSVEEV